MTTLPTSPEFESAYGEALRGLLHELYFKKPHFPGCAGRFPRPAYEELLSQYRRPGWMAAARGDDLVTGLLSEVASYQRIGRRSTRSVDLDAWERAESSINARLRAIFALLTPELAGLLLESLVPRWAPLRDIALSSSKSLSSGKRSDGTFGQPDLVLSGCDVIILIEMKVRGGKARAKYDADQLLKYLRLAEATRDHLGRNLRTFHLIAAPLNRGRVFSRWKEWLSVEPSDGQDLAVRAKGFMRRLSPNRRKQVERRGGVKWLTQSLARTPTAVIDLRRMLAGLDRVARYSVYAAQLQLEVEQIRCLGCGDELRGLTPRSS